LSNRSIANQFVKSLCHPVEVHLRPSCCHDIGQKWRATGHPFTSANLSREIYTRTDWPGAMTFFDRGLRDFDLIAAKAANAKEKLEADSRVTSVQTELVQHILVLCVAAIHCT
jgi:hypothetical protein